MMNVLTAAVDNVLDTFSEIFTGGKKLLGHLHW